MCLYEKGKSAQEIDWNKRNEEIIKIKEWGKAKTKSTYDCIVTVSGDKDSIRQSFFASGNV